MAFPLGKIPTHSSFPIRPPVEDEPVEPTTITYYTKSRTTPQYALFSDIAASPREGDRRTISTLRDRLYINRTLAGETKSEYRFYKGAELDLLSGAIAQSKTTLARKPIGTMPTHVPGLMIWVLADVGRVSFCSSKPNGTRSPITHIQGVELDNLARAVASIQNPTKELQ